MVIPSGSHFTTLMHSIALRGDHYKMNKLMKKIVFVCDVDNFSSGVFSFLESLHENEPFLLTGAFFHSVNFDVSMPTGLAFAPDPLLAFTDNDLEAVNRSIKKFEQKC